MTNIEIIKTIYELQKRTDIQVMKLLTEYLLTPNETDTPAATPTDN